MVVDPVIYNGGGAAIPISSVSITSDAAVFVVRRNSPYSAFLCVVEIRGTRTQLFITGSPERSRLSIYATIFDARVFAEGRNSPPDKSEGQARSSDS